MDEAAPSSDDEPAAPPEDVPTRPPVVRDVNTLLLAIWMLAPRRRWLAVNTDFYGPHFTLAFFVGMTQDLLCAMLEQTNYLRLWERRSSWLHRPSVQLARRRCPIIESQPDLPHAPDDKDWTWCRNEENSAWLKKPRRRTRRIGAPSRPSTTWRRAYPREEPMPHTLQQPRGVDAQGRVRLHELRGHLGQCLGLRPPHAPVQAPVLVLRHGGLLPDDHVPPDLLRGVLRRARVGAGARRDGRAAGADPAHASFSCVCDALWGAFGDRGRAFWMLAFTSAELFGRSPSHEKRAFDPAPPNLRLLNSVYAGRPRYSTSIFLCQLLVTAEALSTYAILHYILVQHFLIIEHGALARRRALAELSDIAAPEEIPLESVGATGDGDEAAADEADAEDVRLSQRFSVSKRSSRVITRDESYDPLRSAEMDTLRRIFSSCDASGDGKIDHRELQTALKWYGVFLSPEDALRNVEIFLSKNNRPIPTAARHLTLNFDDFCEFMLYYDLKYRLAVSVSPSIKNSLLYQPPSLRLDIAARILYIPACIVCTAVLYLVHFGSNAPRSDED